MQAFKGRFRKGIKRIGKTAVIRDCRVGIVNDEIIISVVSYPWKVKSAVIQEKEYNPESDAIRIPLSEEALRNITGKGINLRLARGNKEKTVKLSAKEIHTENDMFIIEEKHCSFDYSRLIKLYNISISDEKAEFCYDIVAGTYERTEFLLLDDEFNVLDRVERNKENDRQAVLNYRRLSDYTKPVQIAALINNNPVPLIVDLSQKTEPDRIVQENGRIYIRRDYTDRKVTTNDSVIEELKTHSDKDSSEKIRFMLDKQGDDVLVRSDNINVKVEYLWENLCTGEETSADNSYTVEEGINLKKSLCRSTEPFERYVLKYRDCSKGRKAEKGYVSISTSTDRLFASKILVADKGNRIVVMSNGSIVLENEDCILSYQDKYLFDFSNCGFRVLAYDKKCSGSKLSFELRLQSSLLKITGAKIIAESDNCDLCLNSYSFDTADVNQTISAGIDLDEVSERIDKKGINSIVVEAEFSNGYTEKDAIYSISDNGQIDLLCVSDKETLN